MKKSAHLISGVLMIILVSGPTSYPVASGSSILPREQVIGTPRRADS
jgi:hypothetical protein